MEFLILGVVIVVVLLVAVVALVTPRMHGTTLPPAPEKAVPPLRTETDDGTPGTVGSSRGTVDTTEPEPKPGGGTAVDTTGPGLETPEPTAGRLVRLRARLSRSQNVLGRGLLALLSRDKLDEDAWEEIEDDA